MAYFEPSTRHHYGVDGRQQYVPVADVEELV
jgi:hypothetical protein